MTARLTITNHERLPATDREMAALVEYWNARHQGQRLPTRRDIDVVDLRQWLSRVSLFEVHDNGDVRIRLWGSSKGRFSWYLRDGIFLRDVKPRLYAENAADSLSRTAAGGTPTRFKVDLDLDGFKYEYDRLALPLAASANLPAMVLTFVKFDPQRTVEFWTRYAQAEGLPWAETALR